MLSLCPALEGCRASAWNNLLLEELPKSDQKAKLRIKGSCLEEVKAALGMGNNLVLEARGGKCLVPVQVLQA